MSYIDVVEEFAVPQLHFPFPPIYIATLWKRSERGETISLRFRLLDPEDTEIAEFSPEITETQALRHRVHILFAGFAIERVGEYQILVEQRRGGQWREEARLYVDVQLGQPQQVPESRSANPALQRR